MAKAIRNTLEPADVYHDDNLPSHENVYNTYGGQESLLALNDNSTRPETETRSL